MLAPVFPGSEDRGDGVLDKSPFFEKSVMLRPLRLLGHVRVYWGFRWNPSVAPDLGMLSKLSARCGWFVYWSLDWIGV
ncbi:MAG: hypothetical protein ABI389_03950 [Rhodanobacter sp.]